MELKKEYGDAFQAISKKRNELSAECFDLIEKIFIELGVDDLKLNDIELVAYDSIDVLTKEFVNIHRKSGHDFYLTDTTGDEWSMGELEYGQEFWILDDLLYTYLDKDYNEDEE